ncbi:MAG: hypothetical protein AAGC55_28030, partial [Myxococcota bacterium]
MKATSGGSRPLTQQAAGRNPTPAVGAVSAPGMRPVLLIAALLCACGDSSADGVDTGALSPTEVPAFGVSPRLG